ncbi:hypothetical protein ACFPA8_10375 [Streptomyces ovatisporus]|uniref:Secreted protein n=1 Tax=Streptomyces ovatisporus TaxID=1128682 RepID=A0ABV9A616_9ACTN
MTTDDARKRTASQTPRAAPAAPAGPAGPAAPPPPEAPPHAVGGPPADPGSTGNPASADPPAPPPVPPGAPADPVAAADSGPGHGLVPPVAAAQRRDRGQEHRTAALRSGDATGPLLGLDERDRLTARLHHAVSGFVDGPRKAVEEADHVFEEAARHLTDALAQRRRALRQPWQEGGDGRAADSAAADAGTEELRLALREYKAATERLLKL